MKSVKYGLILARRRLALTLIGALCVFVPLVGGFLGWIVDVSWHSSSEQLSVDRLGVDGQTVMTPQVTLGSAIERSKAQKWVEGVLGHRSYSSTLTVFELGVKINGITRAVSAGERDWVGQFDGLIRLDAGRIPAVRGEAVVTPALAAATGVTVGDVVEPSRASGKSVAIVGIGVLPLTAGTAEAMLLAPNTLVDVDLDAVRFEWIADRPLTAIETRAFAERGFLLRGREAVGDSAQSLIGREPFIFAGLSAISLLSVLFAARYLIGRARAHSRQVLTSLGARPSFAIRMGLIESAIGALIGGALASALIAWFAKPFSIRAAALANHLPPSLSPMFTLLPVVVLVAVAVVATSSLLETVTGAGVRRAMRKQPKVTSTRSKLSAWQIGGRLARSYRTRSRTLFLLGLVLSGSATAVYVSIDSVNTAAIEQAKLQEQWRQGDIVLYLEGINPPSYLQGQLKGLTDGPSAIIRNPYDPSDSASYQEIGILSQERRGWCRLAVVDTAEQWNILTLTKSTKDVQRTLTSILHDGA